MNLKMKMMMKKSVIYDNLLEYIEIGEIENPYEMTIKARTIKLK